MKKLQMPYNLDPNVLTVYAQWEEYIQDIYFPARLDIFPNARRQTFPKNYSEHEELIVKFCKEHNIRSVLLMNGIVMDMDDIFFEKLTNYMNRMVGLGIDVVVLSNPILIHYFHSHWPQVDIRLSLLSHINTVENIGVVASFGSVKEICLPPIVNRDEDLLKTLKKLYPEIKFSTLLSSSCRLNCPFYYWHQLEFSSSENYELDTHVIMNDELEYNTKLMSQNPLQNATILPEEMDYYDQYFDGFKIEGRQYFTILIAERMPFWAYRINPERFKTLASSGCLETPDDMFIKDFDPGWLKYRRNCKAKLCQKGCKYGTYCYGTPILREGGNCKS